MLLALVSAPQYGIFRHYMICQLQNLLEYRENLCDGCLRPHLSRSDYYRGMLWLAVSWPPLLSSTAQVRILCCVCLLPEKFTISRLGTYTISLGYNRPLEKQCYCIYAENVGWNYVESPTRSRDCHSHDRGVNFGHRTADR
jgi:hypothetical protein